MKPSPRAALAPLLLTLSLASPSAAAAGHGAAAAERLLVDLGPAATTHFPAAPAPLRERRVGVETALLRSADAITLELEPGVEFTARTRLAEATRSGGWAWYGLDPASPADTASIVVHGDAVQGTVRHAGRLYKLSGRAGGVAQLAEFDESAFPRCATGPEHVVTPPVAATELSTAEASPGAPGAIGVDVLVVWTPAARSAVGGTSSIQALIDLAVLETNTAYQNAQVAMELRLVHAAEVNYTASSSMSTDLGRLRSSTDGIMDEVHAWRNQYGADGVSLISVANGACGVGYLMGPPASSSFAGSAFNVTAWSCATGNYTFGHEFGHNWGSHHDRGNAGSTPSHPHSYGYRTPNNAWRTVMSYSPGTRVQYFSNPDVTFAGFPMGIPAGSAQAADNALSLNLNRFVIAGFRDAIPDSYCSGKTNSLGCAPFLSYSGNPSASGGAFNLVANDVVPGEAGFVLYGTNGRSSLNFHGGKLCVKPPFVRLLPAKIALDGAGGPCPGFIQTSFAKRIQSGADPSLTAGQCVNAQWRLRDGALGDGFNDSFTDGLEFVINP